MMTRQMKSSGVEWIGDIPEKWNAKKFKYIFSIIGGNGFPENLQGNCKGDYPFFKCSDINGTEREVLLAKNFVNSNIVDKYKFNIIPSDSILMAKIGEALKKNHRKINKKPCIVDNNMQALVFKSYECLMYYHYLSTILDMMWFDNGGTIPSVNNVKLKNFLLPNPPLSEQKAIADYLDAKCAKIDDFIAKQKTVIEKLKEYKQSVITEAVTKGLNPAAPMKTSGVEWIGDIPEKWTSSKLIWNASFFNGFAFKSEELNLDKEIPVIRIGDIKNGCIDYENSLKSDELPELEPYLLKNRDIVIAMSGATTGKTAYVSEKLKCYINQRVGIIRCCSKYFLYCLNTKGFFQYIELLSNGSAQPNISMGQIMDFKVPNPSFSEQKAIADYLDAKCAKIDTFIAKKQVVIEKLREYKKSLIYECVTGKREIRI